jgi:hypothetical protein
MSEIEEFIREAEKGEEGETLDTHLQNYSKASIDKIERIFRDAYESKWKDELRETLQPLLNASQEGKPLEAMYLLLMTIVARLIGKRRDDLIIHLYLLREIKLLKQKFG